ncbi:unnamed protein product [Penicillium roqueforti FM164]|uniref:Uncharacterized protein n=1 Tax=Penicillium roqueforti (strain FM164) TaxID=1365484 RepID=W6R4W9_PENRF|nr:unnamed protein product [Penicillium roqueforti FM164]
MIRKFLRLEIFEHFRAGDDLRQLICNPFVEVVPNLMGCSTIDFRHVIVDDQLVM